MIKLYKARFLLYRRRIWQENIRFEALDEIYKIYMLCTAQSSTNIQRKFVQDVFYLFPALRVQIPLVPQVAENRLSVN